MWRTSPVLKKQYKGFRLPLVLFNLVGDLVVELRRQRNQEKKEGKVLFNPVGDLVVELRRQRNREKKEGKGIRMSGFPSPSPSGSSPAVPPGYPAACELPSMVAGCSGARLQWYVHISRSKRAWDNNSFSSKAAHLWNALSSELRYESSERLFRKKLKTVLFRN
ncbi:hypothetical protein NDU88_003307 [Pleurodeles waltl]|uniref:Uncharacterized protein n=1 Tax=Pleurodeles waltl TaxID=8319 RepID=A0AAV7WR39_PLEWA|nr:hypothetical protein NDU88_003307 [Pleurodeles waltl]